MNSTMKKGFQRLGLWHDSVLGLDSGYLLVSEGLDDWQLFNRLFKFGLNLKAHRFRHAYTLVGVLGHPWEDDAHPKQSIKNFVALLNLIVACEHGNEMLPPRALIASMRDWGIPVENIESVPPNLFKALWAACMLAEYHVPKNQLATERFIKRKLLPMLHWYFNIGRHYWDKDSITYSWFSFERRYEKWRNEEANMHEELAPAPAQWDELVPSMDVGDFRFVPLASATALVVEGRQMQHCIADYAHRCRIESLRAFSIRNCESGKRLATMTIKEDAVGNWTIDELNGQRNWAVPENIEQAALAFAAGARSFCNQHHCVTA
jgi:hypothetical protein